jgi:hypothetical protein
MSDIVKIDRSALSDLIHACSLLTELVANPSPVPTEEENQRIAYINKLIITATQSYNKHNK